MAKGCGVRKRPYRQEQFHGTDVDAQPVACMPQHQTPCGESDLTGRTPTGFRTPITARNHAGLTATPVAAAAPLWAWHSGRRRVRAPGRRTTPIAACLAVALAFTPYSAVAQERTISIAAHYTADQMAPLEACFRTYEAAHPGVRIVYQQSAIGDYMQTVLTARMAGTSPDIYNVYSLWAGQMVAAGMLAQPPAPVQALLRDSYLPSAVDGARLNGTAWGIPGEISTYMLVYNKALLRQAGYDAPPRTWEELRQVAAKITRRNAQGNITTAGYAFGPTVANAVHPFLALLLSAGETLVKPDLSATNLGTPQAETALAGMVRLFADGVTSNAVQGRDFPSGTIGMAILANWLKDLLRAGMGEDFRDKVGVAPIPAGDAWRTYQYSFFWSVDARSRNREAAWDLLLWLNTPRSTGARSCTGEMLVRMGGLTGNNADIAASPAELGDDFTRPYVDAIASGRAVAGPNLVHATEIQQALGQAIQKAWGGTLTPAQALHQADRVITPLLADEP